MTDVLTRQEAISDYIDRILAEAPAGEETASVRLDRDLWRAVQRALRADGAMQARAERAEAALAPFDRAAGFHVIESQGDPEAHILLRREDGFASALRVKDFREARAVCEASKTETAR